MASTETKPALITVPNPALRKPSKKVGLITKQVDTLIRQMEDQTLEWEDGREHEVGVALAAIQIGEPMRIIIVRKDFENKEDRTFNVFINPVITKYEGVTEVDFEGCLSVKDIYGKVPRYQKVRVKALDRNGKEVRFSVEGFLARIFQHEIDHTNGKLFIDHIKDDSDAFYRLTPDGSLEKLDYANDVKNNHLLWE